jgi:hypothetical protein
VEGIRDVEISINAGPFFPGINKGNNVWELPAKVNINPGDVTDFFNVSDPNDKGGDTAVLEKSATTSSSRSSRMRSTRRTRPTKKTMKPSIELMILHSKLLYK